MIQSEVAVDERLGACSPMARLLCLMLPMASDRRGRLEDRPLKLKALLLPYDTIDVDVLLNELADKALVVRYAAKGKRIIWLPDFWRTQKPHPNESETSLPRPPAEAIERFMADASAKVRAEHVVDDCPDASGGNDEPPTSSTLATKVASECAQGDKSVEPKPESHALGLSLELGVNLESAAHTSPPAGGGKRRAAAIDDATVEAIYKAYPRQVGKKAATVAIHNACKQLRDRGVASPGEYLMEAVKAYADSPKGRSEPNFIPHPKTWFNEGRFDDDRAEWNHDTSRSPKGNRLSGRSPMDDLRKAQVADACARGAA